MLRIVSMENLIYWDQSYHNMNINDYTKEKPDYKVEQERWEKEGYDI